MPLVHVSGFPGEVKLLVSFRKYLSGSGIARNYWITEVADIRNSNLKEATIDFKSMEDALRAEEFMNAMAYFKDGRQYKLIARIIDSDNGGGHSSHHNDRYQEEHYYRSRSREYSNEGYGSSHNSGERNRSRSPLEEHSKIDMEIELLRKKRLLIEEERRLLLEKKKLEMIKEFGPNACAEIDGSIKRESGTEESKLFQDISSKELENDQRVRDRLLRPKWTGNPKDKKVRAPPAHQRALAHIPQFVLPCKIILAQMKKAIKAKVPVLHERTILSKLISANLRRRFAIVLENKSYMPSDAIAKLYRKVYPMSSDAELIDNTYQEVKASHWPKRVQSQKVLDKRARKKAEKAAAKKGKEVITVEDDEIKPDISAKAAVNVKPEPNVETVVTPNTQTPAPSEVKVENIDPPRVKAELNTTVVEVPDASGDDDWAENGVDWNDDDDEGAE